MPYPRKCAAEGPFPPGGKASLCLRLLSILVAAAGLPTTSAASRAHPVRNVIIMIGDGAGYNHVEAASVYQYGRPGGQIYHQFPVRCGMST